MYYGTMSDEMFYMLGNFTPEVYSKLASGEELLVPAFNTAATHSLTVLK